MIGSWESSTTFHFQRNFHSPRWCDYPNCWSQPKQTLYYSSKFMQTLLKDIPWGKFTTSRAMQIRPGGRKDYPWCMWSLPMCFRSSYGHSWNVQKLKLHGINQIKIHEHSDQLQIYTIWHPEWGACHSTTVTAFNTNAPFPLDFSK